MRGAAYGLGILNALLDGGSPHEQVTAGGAPEHPLEGDHLGTLDDTGDEAQLDAERGKAGHLAAADVGLLVVAVPLGTAGRLEEHAVLLEHVLELNELVVVALQLLLVAVHLSKLLLEVLEAGLQSEFYKNVRCDRK